MVRYEFQTHMVIHGWLLSTRPITTEHRPDSCAGRIGQSSREWSVWRAKREFSNFRAILSSFKRSFAFKYYGMDPLPGSVLEN